MKGTAPSILEERLVGVPCGNVILEANLVIPEGAIGAVVFAHGTGSGRRSPRNRHVAGILQERGLATMLIDLLTAEEDSEDQQTAHLRFDVRLLSERLAGAKRWLAGHAETRHMDIGYFGSSTGAGAALLAAAEHPAGIGAVVSRGGRPDLAGVALERVTAPTLLVVGASDLAVVGLNRCALSRMTCEKRLEIVPGATHLFEEPGTLQTVADLASRWFKHHLGVE